MAIIILYYFKCETMKKDNKTAFITARVREKVKEFFEGYRGLPSKVLEDFYTQYKEMQEKKIIKKESKKDKR